MGALTESEVEAAALAWLEALGYQVLHGLDIAVGEPGAERSDPAFRDVVLERRLRDALARLNPDLPPDCSLDRASDFRMKKNRELFYLVYRAVGETSPCPLTFNAHYGLFRVLLTMFALLALAALAGLSWAWCCRPV